MTALGILSISAVFFAFFAFMFVLYSILSLFLLLFIPDAGSLPTSGAGAPALERRAVSEELLDQLTRFAQFSSAAYIPGCSSPLGTTSVATLNDAGTDTQGFVARDDTNKQIIVAFRGSSSVQDFATDAQVDLVPFESQGVTDTNNSKAHSGFLSAYNSVASDVLSAVSSELASNPDYTIISTGHSLGGALASIAGVSLAANFPNASLQMFTFGQPRTGDAAYAGLAENLVGTDSIFRGVHTTDGVPTIIPETLGYQHHATEFWQFQEPSNAENVKQCSGGEDPTCSTSIPSGGINLAHITYFGQVMATNFLSC